MPEPKLDDLMVDQIVELFEKKDFKKKFLKKVNDNVDIPLINEKTEAKVLKALYSAVLDTLKDLN